MYKNLAFAVLLFACLTGCKSKSAYNYSQNIVAKEKSLVPDMESTENKVARYVAADQYDSIGVAGAYMEGRVQKAIDEINAMPVPGVKESDNFKKAILRYFGYIKSIYTVYKELGLAQTEEERGDVLKNLQKLVSGKQTAIADMQRAQRKYAEVNGFRIE